MELAVERIRRMQLVAVSQRRRHRPPADDRDDAQRHSQHQQAQQHLARTALRPGLPDRAPRRPAALATAVLHRGRLAGHDDHRADRGQRGRPAPAELGHPSAHRDQVRTLDLEALGDQLLEQREGQLEHGGVSSEQRRPGEQHQGPEHRGARSRRTSAGRMTPPPPAGRRAATRARLRRPPAGCSRSSPRAGCRPGGGRGAPRAPRRRTRPPRRDPARRPVRGVTLGGKCEAGSWSRKRSTATISPTWSVS